MKVRKECSDCGKVRLAKFFGINSGRPDGLQQVCKACQTIRRNDYNRRFPEKKKKRELDDYYRNLVVKRADMRMRNAELRKQMIAAYGGKCACPACPETNPAFLNLHHKKGNGKEDRARFGNSSGLWRVLRSLGWPKKGYGLLCWNCNCATRLGRKCPHVLTSSLMKLVA